MLEQVCRLTISGLANRGQGAEAQGLGLAAFQNGEVGQGDAHGFVQSAELHLAPGQHHVEVHENGHQITTSASWLHSTQRW